MKRETKDTVVKDLEAAFAASDTYYLVDFKQMPVSRTIELRRLLRKNAFTYKVVKNRLALKALQDKCPDGLKPHFQKPTGIAFAAQDPIGLAKLLKEFSAQGKILAVKAGVVEGHFMAPERFEEVVRLSSRENLLGKVGFLMAYPLTQLLRTLRAPLGNLGLALGQLKNQNRPRGLE